MVVYEAIRFWLAKRQDAVLSTCATRCCIMYDSQNRIASITTTVGFFGLETIFFLVILKALAISTKYHHVRQSKSYASITYHCRLFRARNYLFLVILEALAISTKYHHVRQPKSYCFVNNH